MGNSTYISQNQQSIFLKIGAKYLGDPDFYTVPEKSLIDSLYLLQRSNKINMDSTLLSSGIYARENV